MKFKSPEELCNYIDKCVMVMQLEGYRRTEDRLPSTDAVIRNEKEDVKEQMMEKCFIKKANNIPFYEEEAVVIPVLSPGPIFNRKVIEKLADHQLAISIHSYNETSPYSWIFRNYGAVLIQRAEPLIKKDDSFLPQQDLVKEILGSRAFTFDLIKNEFDVKITRKEFNGGKHKQYTAELIRLGSSPKSINKAGTFYVEHLQESNISGIYPQNVKRIK